MKGPNYNLIYNDIVKNKFPERFEELQVLLSSKIEKSIDIIKVNDIIFKRSEHLAYNQKLKSYDEYSIKKILEFQQKNNMSNKMISDLYKISRNTIARWKKIIKIEN